VRMIIPIFVCHSPNGRCYGNRLNLGDVHRHRQKRPLLFASAFDNGLADCKSAFKRLYGNNPATSCTNLVNFRPIINNLGVYAVKTHSFFSAIRSHYDDDLHSSPWRSETDWKIAILISAEWSAIISLHLIEIGEIRFNNPGV